MSDGIEGVLAAHPGLAEPDFMDVRRCAGLFCGWSTRDRYAFDALHRAHVAAAIRAHLLSDEVVDRVCDVLDDHGHNGIDCRPRPGLDFTVRAALTAATNGDQA
jgi:hypothetical protein